jgi:hypothetical protein
MNKVGLEPTYILNLKINIIYKGWYVRMKNKCYCCNKKRQTTKLVFGTTNYDLCQECMKDFENARLEIDKLRK